MTLYSADFDVTGGDLSRSSEVEQVEGCIKLNLETDIQVFLQSIS